MSQIVRSFTKAFVGLGYLLREPNAKIHLAAVLVVAGAGYLLTLPPAQWAILATNFGLVLALETINTALEGYVDLAAPGRHEVAARAKDAAAGAVLLAAMASVVVAVVLFGPRLGELWRQVVAVSAAHPLAFGTYTALAFALLLHGLFRRGG